MTRARYYLHVFVQLLRQSLIRDIQFRSNWIFANLNTLAWSMMRVLFYTVSFQHVTTVGDWTYERSLILTATFLMGNALYKIFFDQNIRRFTGVIFEGEFDFMLLKPLNTQFLVSLRVIRYNLFIRFLAGLAILLWALFSLGVSITLWGAALYIFSMLIGILIFYHAAFIVVTSCFWLGNVKTLGELTMLFSSMTYMPFDVLPKAGVKLFTLLIPIIFVATVPARIFFTRDPSDIYLALGILAVFFVLSQVIWKKALSGYSGVSS